MTITEFARKEVASHSKWTYMTTSYNETWHVSRKFRMAVPVVGGLAEKLVVDMEIPDEIEGVRCRHTEVTKDKVLVVFATIVKFVAKAITDKLSEAGKEFQG